MPPSPLIVRQCRYSRDPWRLGVLSPTRAYFDNTHDHMTDVWDFPRVTGEDRHGHPTPKPLAVIERMVLSSTPVGSLVYEPFLGSGTTLIACQNVGRVCRGLELDPGFTAVTLQRWADRTGETPQLLVSGT